LRQFLKNGYGKKKNTGFGQFSRIDLQELSQDDWPACDPAQTDSVLCLSSFVPASQDPTDGYWQTFTKYGKFGEAAVNLDGYRQAETPNVFKNPVTRLKAGAVLRLKPKASPREWYGTSHLSGVRDESDYVHPALTLGIPYRSLS
jgi:hypothetical protein